MYTVIAHSASPVSSSGYSTEDLTSENNLTENVRVVASMKDMLMAPEEPGEVSQVSDVVCIDLLCLGTKCFFDATGHANDGRRECQDFELNDHRIRLHSASIQGGLQPSGNSTVCGHSAMATNES